jgi:hypothetical protein
MLHLYGIFTERNYLNLSLKLVRSLKYLRHGKTHINHSTTGYFQKVNTVTTVGSLLKMAKRLGILNTILLMVDAGTQKGR